MACKKPWVIERRNTTKRAIARHVAMFPRRRTRAELRRLRAKVKRLEEADRRASRRGMVYSAARAHALRLTRYHKPDRAGLARIRRMRAAAAKFIAAINREMPHFAHVERHHAIDRAREALFWANAGIALALGRPARR